MTLPTAASLLVPAEEAIHLMHDYSVYLAGQITNDPASLAWREDAKHLLPPYAQIISPLRGKPGLATDPAFLASKGMQATNVNPNSIMIRDYNDVRSASLILVNMHTYDPERGLQGTYFELAWAWARRVPTVGFWGTPEQQQHPFLRAAITEWHPDLETAVDSIRRYWLR